MNKIRLENINKFYGTEPNTVHALKNVTLDIKDGELLAIMGRSGSGKSTLLKVLGGLTGIQSGEYYYGGKLLKNKENQMSRFRNQHIGFIVQNYALLFDRTVFDNVELPLRYSHIAKRTREEMVMDILEKVGMDDLADRFPGELSGGECQRVAIARAIVNNPEIILADEPTGALDEETEKLIMNILIDLNKEGKTIIVVTHDSQIANQLNRIVYLRNGEVIPTSDTLR
ncbi:MAG: ABC transporter ATP-binding protein [Acetivibrionales bacterium]|jgi:putative ABC transport system ATP-binding protein|nr:ABC transporter ATP-binding protein [Clostridiaceae bacterium]